MNWETLLNHLKGMADDEGKMPAFMDEPVTVQYGDDLIQLRIVQDLESGELMLVPVFT